MSPRTRPKIVLTVAPTGAAYSRDTYPSLPITLEQLLEDAKQCYAAGARSIHYHARDQNGRHCADPAIYQRVRDLLAHHLPGVPVSFASSRKGEVEAGILRRLMWLNSQYPGRENSPENLLAAELVRIGGLDARPDGFTVLTPPEILMCGEIAHEDRKIAFETYSELTKNSWRDPEIMQAYFRHMTLRTRSQGIGEEFELTTTKSLDVVEKIAADPTLRLPPCHTRFILLFGFSSRLAITKESYEHAVARCVAIGERFGVRTHITVGAAIHPNHAHPGPERKQGEPMIAGKHDLREIIEWVANDPRVDTFRTGIEDSPMLYGRPMSNPELVRHVREIFAEHLVGIELDLHQVRKTFELASPSRLEPAA